jgi:HK97 family phage prohead protease
MEMERKTFPFELEEKGLDLEQGTFAGYAAVCGNLDDGGDIVDYGAFAKTIQERGPDSPRNRLKVFRYHDFMTPIGKIIEIREVPRGKMPKPVLETHPGITGGLFVKGQISHTPAGEEVLTLMRDTVVDEMSIGYDAVKEAFDEEQEGETRIRHLKEIKLYCCDPVPMAMNPAAVVTDVKSQTKDTEVGEGPPEEFKPYPNEHACRLKDPGQYDTCRRGERVAHEPESVDGKKYVVIYCKKGDGPMEQQAFRYPKDDWTAEQARAHCDFNDGKFEAAQEEDEDDEKAQRQEIEQALMEAGLREAEIQKELIEASGS